MLDVKDLELIAGALTKALEPVNQRLDVIGDKLDEFDSRLSNVEAELVVVKERVTMLEDNVINIISRLSTLESNVININARLSEIEMQVRKANLNLENEVRYGIRAIADGHFFLLQKLDNALLQIKSAERNYENFQLRLIFLESEFKKMQDIA
ncbi:MAG: hypothetical protein IJX63_16155 [Lachnospiraceae bacterium]|nr:hypothetical protein [Lachnospiraceae bacterium]